MSLQRLNIEVLESGTKLLNAVDNLPINEHTIELHKLATEHVMKADALKMRLKAALDKMDLERPCIVQSGNLYDIPRKDL